jgi:hypothetical protein
MLLLQVMENKNVSRWFNHRRQGNRNTVEKSIDCGSMVELTSTTTSVTDDTDELDTLLIQQLVDNEKNTKILSWDEVATVLKTTFAQMEEYKRGFTNTVTYEHSYSDEDDDDDNDAIHILYNGCGTTTVKAIERQHFATQQNDVVVASVNGSDATLDLILNEFRILYQNHNIYDIHVHQSLLALLLSHGMVESRSQPDGMYEGAIRMMSSFLIDPSVQCESKLAAIHILLIQQLHSASQYADDTTAVHLQQNVVNWNSSNEYQILRDVYAFCIAICFGVNDMECTLTTSTGSSGSHLISPLLWELRSNCLYLQEMHAIFDDISSSSCTILPSPSHPSSNKVVSKKDQQWEQVKNYLYETDSVLLKDIDLLRALHNVLGIRHVIVIASVGYIRIYTYHSSRHQQNGNEFHYTTAAVQYKYTEALHHVAQFLVDWTISDRNKIAVVQCLQYEWDNHRTISTESLQQIYPTTTPSSNNTHAAKDGLFHTKVLSFCIDPNAYTDSFLMRNDTAGPNENGSYTCLYYLLLWEIRVLCCHYVQKGMIPVRQYRRIRSLWHQVTTSTTTTISTRTRSIRIVSTRMMGTLKTAIEETMVSCSNTIVQKYHTTKHRSD